MNLSYSVKLGEPSGPEPCTLQQCKDQLKIDFSTDDALITALISAARAQIEQYCGVSIVDHEVNLVAKLDGCNLFELPYGPVDHTTIDLIQLAVSGGTNDEDPTFDTYGEHFVQIKSYDDAMFAVTYTAGYTEVPEPLAQAVIHQVAYLYEHRGDEDIPGMSPTAKILANPYRRVVI